MSPKLDFFHVSKSDTENLSRLAQQYQTLRLTALQLSASSFSSTYEIESKHPPAYWELQLANPEEELFICSAGETDPTLSDPTANTTAVPLPQTWIAQVVLRGPILHSHFRLPPAASQSDLPTTATSSAVEHYQLKALYVNPNYRNLAVSQRLIARAIAWLRDTAFTRSTTHLRIRAMVRPDNVASQRLFQKIGFARDGTCTLREAGVANGEIQWEEREKEFPAHYDMRGGHIYILDAEV